MIKRFLVTVTICISVLLLSSQLIGINRAESKGKLELRLLPKKSVLKLGEAVYFTVEAVNIGDQNLSFSNTFSEGSGHLHVLISHDGNNFRQYEHSEWGLDDTFRGNINLDPGENIKRTLSLLWNKKPNSPSSIADDVIKRASEGKILTDYAFPEARTYYVKATYSVNLTTQEKPILLETKPVKLTIEEPVGENLEVWNKIKNNGHFAYFIQEGDLNIPSYKSDERERFLKEVEQLIVNYPNSSYAQSLSQSLEKFRAGEAKRQEFLQKVQKQKEKPQ